MMLHLSAYLNFLPEKMRLATKPYIEHHFVTSKPFTQRKPRAHKTSRSQWRRYCNSLNSFVAGDIQGSCIVVRLRNNCQRLAPKDLFGSDNRIESSETGIIEYNSVCRYTKADQGIAHSCRFVIEACMIIPACNYIFHFPGVIQISGRLYPICEIAVGAAATIPWICSQKQSHTITRYRRHILKYKTFGCIFNSNVNIDCKYHYDYSNRSNAKKQTPDGLFQSVSLA